MGRFKLPLFADRFMTKHKMCIDWKNTIHIKHATKPPKPCRHDSFGVLSDYSSSASERMKAATVIGILLIALGAAALVYKGFNYTTEETVLQLGPVKATAETEKTVAIPMWAGIAAIAIGAVVIVVGRRG